ncbi:MAG: methyltransferase domain-containing protein [Gemmataceae bacterium]
MIKRMLLAVPVLVLAVVAGLAAQEDMSKGKSKFYNDTFVPTPDEVTGKMLELSKCTKDSIVYDLGCGEADMLIFATKKYGCKCMGIEFNPERADKAREKVKKAGLDKMIEIRTGDALTVKDIGKADIIILYMFPGFLNHMREEYEGKWKSGARIASHDYKWETPGWEPDVALNDFKGPTRTHRIYLWTAPAKKSSSKEKS